MLKERRRIEKYLGRDYYEFASRVYTEEKLKKTHENLNMPSNPRPEKLLPCCLQNTKLPLTMKDQVLIFNSRVWNPVEILIFSPEIGFFPWTLDVNWTYIRRTEVVLWTSYICWSYTLCLAGLFLSECKHWFVEGPFKVCSESLLQHYTPHTQKRGYIFPYIFSLLLNKMEATYTLQISK